MINRLKRNGKSGKGRFENKSSGNTIMTTDQASHQAALVSYKLKKELKAKDATSLLKNEIKGS